MTDRPKSDAHALQTLGDVPLVLYAAKQAAKLFWAIVTKRWPELR